MKNKISISLFMIMIMLFVQCRKDEIITVTPTITDVEGSEDVSFLIYLTNAQGASIEGATVTIPSHGKTYSSDANGVLQFTLETISFLGENILIDHAEYDEIVKKITGVSHSKNTIHVVLTKSESKIIATGESGNIGEGTLTLPTTLLSNDGSDYIGDVTVRYTYLSPDEDIFLLAAPGNLLAHNDDGTLSQLASLGMYSVKLFDTNGEELSIPVGSTAQLAFPVADVHKGVVPEVIPLWYFDEVEGLWIRDGEARLESDRMIAEVSHFTWWNCDLPYDFISQCIQFVNSSDLAAVGVNVKFSVDGVRFGNAITDDNGRILAKVPRDQIVSLAYFIGGERVGEGEMGPLSTSIPKLQIEVGLSFTSISGVALDCEMKEIAQGYAVIEKNDIKEIVGFNNGSFAWKAVEIGSYDLYLYDIENEKELKLDVEVPEIGDEILLGTLVVCDGNITTGIQGRVMEDTNGDGIADTPVSDIIVNVEGDFNTEMATDENGFYQFSLPPGQYQIYVYSIGLTKTFYGVDDIHDGDEFDGLRGKRINVVVSEEEVDDENNFYILPPSNSSVSGKVFIDTDNDGVGDMLGVGYKVSLNTMVDGVTRIIEVDESGSFNFILINEVLDGHLTLDGFNIQSISDYDESPDPDGDDSTDGPNNFIPVSLDFKEHDDDNNFVIKGGDRGTISGTVLEDTDGDGIGDRPLIGVEVSAHAILPEYPRSTITDEDGNYVFFNNPVGIEYNISIASSGYGFISDFDESPDPDGDDSADGPNNSIPVYIESGEIEDAGNNFVLRTLDRGVISGFVLQDTDGDGVGDTPLEGLGINLRNDNNNTIGAIITDANGYYEFADIVAGDYSVWEQEEAEIYPLLIDVYDGDDTPEDANDAVDGLNDDVIQVTLEEGEVDSDNNFVEREE